MLVVLEHSPLTKVCALRVHLGLDLLAHRAAQQIGAGRANSRRAPAPPASPVPDRRRCRKSRRGFLPQQRVRDRGSPPRPFLRRGEHRDIVHRAWPIERAECDDIARTPVGLHRTESVRRMPSDSTWNTPTVSPRLKQICTSRSIVPRERVDRSTITPLCGEHRPPPCCSTDKRLQAEEIELHQPRALDIFHVELGDRHVLIGDRGRAARADRAADRRSPRRPRASDAVARQALQLHRQIERGASPARPVSYSLAEFGRRRPSPSSAVQRPRIGRVVGHELGEAIDLAIAHLEHTAGILQHRARLQPPEGDDLRDMIAAIFRLDVARSPRRAAFRRNRCRNPASKRARD